MLVGRTWQAWGLVLLLLIAGCAAAACSSAPGARRADAPPLPPIEVPVSPRAGGGPAPRAADSILQAHLREAVARLGDPDEPRGPVARLLGLLNTADGPTLLGVLNTGTGIAAKEPPETVRVSAKSETSRLPPEVIRDTVRAGFAPFRRCYQQVLVSSPELAARVETTFVIDPAGKVTGAKSTSAAMPPAALTCIEKAFGALKFPAPSGGVVKVTYPIVFSPAGDAGAEVTPSRPAAAPPPSAPPPGGRPPIVKVTVGLDDVVPRAPPPDGPWPIVAVEGTAVSLDGAVVARASAPGAEPEREVLEPLRDALAARRTKWIASHPGARFPDVVGVRFDPAVPLGVFRVVLRSAVRAGFQRLFVQSASDPNVVAAILAHVRGSELEGEVLEIRVDEPTLLASVARGELVLRWSTFTTIAAEDRSPFAASDVAPRLCASWRAHGVHRAPEDRQRDHLVLELAEAGTVADLETFTRAAASCLRPRRAADGTSRAMPAFWVSVRGD